MAHKRHVAVPIFGSSGAPTWILIRVAETLFGTPKGKQLTTFAMINELHE